MDTTSGPVSQTEVNYGPVSSVSVASPPDITDAKTGRTTDNGSAPIYTAESLSTSATYLFRLRDYGMENFVATAWCPWVPFTAGAALGTSAQIALSDRPVRFPTSCKHIAWRCIRDNLYHSHNSNSRHVQRYRKRGTESNSAVFTYHHPLFTALTRDIGALRSHNKTAVRTS